MAPPVLEIDNLTMRFGGLTAIDRLSFKVERGAIHGLIGPNGAGKTTTFNVVSGFYKPTGGEVRLRGETISGLRMYEVAPARRRSDLSALDAIRRTLGPGKTR